MTTLDPQVNILAEQVQAAYGTGQTVAIAGAGSKQFFAKPEADQVLDMTSYSGVIDYDPRELVVTVKAGTPLQELQQLLAENGQMLASESPHFGAATIGGAVACGWSGSRRTYAGALRDYVLGATMINGQGEVLNFGGQVMKNVAGFDVSRLLCGSFGCLGAIVQLSLKVLPLPKAEITQRLAVSMTDAIQQTRHWLGQGLPISGSAYYQGHWYLRLSAGEQTLAALAKRVGGDTVSNDFWTQLVEQQLAFFSGDTPLWRLSLAATSELTLEGEQLFDWGGQLRWLQTDASAEQVLAAAQQAGGHAQLFRGGATAPFANVSAGVRQQWQQQLQQAFTAAVFNPNLQLSANATGGHHAA